MKTFTWEEAQSLLPVVEALMDRALKAQAEGRRLDEKMARLKVRIFHSGGMWVDVVAAYRDAAESRKQAEVVTEVMEEIASIGVQVKDLDAGLLDFPCHVDGETVLLCWKRGELAIEYWHTVEEGFQGRKKIDERFVKRAKLDRLN